MSHQTVHLAGQVVSGADFDRIIALLRNGIIQYPSGLSSALVGQIDSEQLTPELQSVLVSLIGNSGGLGSYDLHHFDISSIAESNSAIILLGKTTDATTGAASGVREVFAVDAISLTTKALTPVIVDSIATSERDYPDMVKCGDYVWAIGNATTGQNAVTKINVDTLASTGFTLGADTAATVSALATDNVYVYAFEKHSTTYYPNSFIKIASDGTVAGLIYSGLTTTGNVTMCMSNNGYLYASFDDATVKQVRKYDTSPINGLQEVFSVSDGDFLSAPTMICAVDSYIYVLNGIYLHRISTSSGVSELLHTYATAPDKIYYDGVTLWVADGEELYKCDKSGNIIQTTIPNAGQNILSIRKSFGFLWNTYSNDDATNENITKTFPGLPL